MLLYIGNSKEATRKLLELINEYSKVAGYKINTEKSLAFLYTNNERTERESKETTPFTIAMKIIKYLEDSPLNCAFSSRYNPLVAGYRASDLHPKITAINFRNKT